VTEKPGFWFGVFSGKSIIPETDLASGRNDIAETILDLAYEVEHPLTMVRVYEWKGAISNENYVSVNELWKRVSYLHEEGVFLSYRENSVSRNLNLFSMNKEIVFEQSSPQKLIIKYYNEEILLTESISVQNESYPVNVVWGLSPLRSEIDDASLYVSNFFDLQFSFEKAYVPGFLNWENPWNKPTSAEPDQWAVVEFSSKNLTADYIGVYDEEKEVVFAIKFPEELPDWGNVGALATMQIDAVRFRIEFGKVPVNGTVRFAYQILTFSKSSFPEMQGLSGLGSLFDFEPASAFAVSLRNYADYIRKYEVEFLVYDKERFSTDLLQCGLLQLVFSNDKYVIFRVKNS
jgi:hypothetical protein